MKKSITNKPKKMSITIKKLPYEKDFVKWTATQSALLKKGDFTKLDVKNLIEEISSLGVSERRALRSYLTILLLHMLKITYQPEMQKNSNSWESSIRNSKIRIALLIEDSPSLKGIIEKEADNAYKLARIEAEEETGISISNFPEVCPWKIKEVLGLLKK